MIRYNYLPTLRQDAMKKVEEKTLEELVKVDPATGLKVLPYWMAQPYFRPLPIAKERS